jgi:hypothetical protein
MTVNRRRFLGSIMAAGAVGLFAPRVGQAAESAHNSFTNPRGLEPRDEQVEVGSGGSLVYRFQPASVTRLQLTLS